MAISTHHSAKPKRKCPIASRRVLNVYRPVAFAAGVEIRDHHQADDDQRRDRHAGDPRIEVDEQLLQADEVPRRLRRVFGLAGVGLRQQRRVARQRPHHQQHGDQQRRQELFEDEVREDVDGRVTSAEVMA